jgi:hypothetical protein
MSHATKAPGGVVPEQRSREGMPTVPEQTGWIGWIVFASLMMIMLGAFHAIAGFVALFQEEYFLVASSGLVVDVDYTAWGWTHLVLGAVVVAAGFAVLAGQMWARVVTVVVAMLSAVVNLAFLAAHPVWSMMMIAFDVLVIYAVTVHGSELRRSRR